MPELTPEEKSRIISTLLRSGWEIFLNISDTRSLALRKPGLELVDCFIIKTYERQSSKGKVRRLPPQPPNYSWRTSSHILAVSTDEIDWLYWLIPTSVITGDSFTLKKEHVHYQICLEPTSSDLTRQRSLSEMALRAAGRLEDRIATMRKEKQDEGEDG